MNPAALNLPGSRQRDVVASAIGRQHEDVAPAESFARKLALSRVETREQPARHEQPMPRDRTALVRRFSIRDQTTPRERIASVHRLPVAGQSTPRDHATSLNHRVLDNARRHAAARQASSTAASGAANKEGAVEEAADSNVIDVAEHAAKDTLEHDDDRDALQQTAAITPGQQLLASSSPMGIEAAASLLLESDNLDVTFSLDAAFATEPSSASLSATTPLELANVGTGDSSSGSPATPSGTDESASSVGTEQKSASPWSSVEAQGVAPGANARGGAESVVPLPFYGDRSSQSAGSSQPVGATVTGVDGSSLEASAGDADAGSDTLNAPADAVDAADVTGKTMSRLAGMSAGDATTSSSSSAPTVAPPNPASTPTSVPVVQGAQQQPSVPIASDEDAIARQNIDRIVNGVRGDLLPRGGSMQIRLDPPQLGSLNVSVRVQDGVLSATFQTSNEQATQMLSQTMTQLKSALEATGVSVERLHVRQTSASRSSDDTHGSNGDGRQQPGEGDQQSFAQNEHQRREMLQRMWRRLGIGNDPLDLVA